MLKADEIQKLIREWVPMADDIDLIIEEVREGYARIRIPFQEKSIRPGGTVSGPVMMTAVDTAMYAAILGSLGEVAMAVTSNLNINFLQRPEQKDLIAEGTIIKLGKRIAFCEVALKAKVVMSWLPMLLVVIPCHQRVSSYPSRAKQIYRSLQAVPAC